MPHVETGDKPSSARESTVILYHPGLRSWGLISHITPEAERTPQLRLSPVPRLLLLPI